MANTFDFTRLRRLIIIYRVVQIFLLVLLAVMAVSFQSSFQAKGMPQIFFNSILTTLVVQLLLFYFLNKFAAREAEQEIAGCARNIAIEQVQALRKKRLFGDYIKAAVFIFFVTFSVLAPGATFIQSTIFFVFVLTILTYFQCFNFAAHKGMQALR